LLEFAVGQPIRKSFATDPDALEHSVALQLVKDKLGVNQTFTCINKYAGLSSQGKCVPTAVESHGPINKDALQFLSELGSWRLVETTGDVRASSFLFQRISVVVQRFNSVLLHDGFIDGPK